MQADWLLLDSIELASFYLNTPSTYIYMYFYVLSMYAKHFHPLKILQ